MMNLKEKKMLLKMKSAMGEDVTELRAQIEAEEVQQTSISESRRAAFEDIFSGLAKNLNELAVQDKKRTSEQQALVESLGQLFSNISSDPQVPQEIKDELVKIDETPEMPVEPDPPPSVVDKVVQHVKETTAPSMFVQPNPPTVDKDIKAIQNKLKLLEGWVSKISMTGPGGGAGEIYNLDMPTTVVTTSSYTVGRKDYYVGVNYAGTTTITLPSTAKQGRYLIIKDESGRCSKYPIIVHGNVDNDPGGFILKINNGGIQMIYRNGWRIV